MATDNDVGNQNESEQDDQSSVGASTAVKEWLFVESEVAELADRYFDLVLYLKKVNEDLSTSANPLEECLDALVAIKRFLEIDPIVAKSGIVRPLAMLALKLRDVTLGAKPEMLRASRQTGTRPRSLSGLIARQATVAACTEVLIHYRMPVKEDCEFVLRALEKAKQINRAETKPIKWQKIKRWREEMGSRNPPESLAIYNGISLELKKALGPDATLDAAKREVPHCISFLKHSGTAAI